MSYNTAEYLQRCIESIFQHTKGVSFEVIVVDNASADGTVKIIQREFPEVHLIQNKYNSGFTRANNQGIVKSRADYIVLLNSDTILVNDAISYLLEGLASHPEVAIVGPKLLNPDGTFQQGTIAPNFHLSKNFIFGHSLLADKLWGIFKRRFRFLQGALLEEDLHGPQEVAWLVGACMMIRRTFLEEAGTLDENIFMYYEDMEICLRASRHNWRVMVIPQGVVIHLVHGSSMGDGKFISRNQVQTIKYLCGKYKELPSFNLFRVAAFWGSMLKLPVAFAMLIFVPAHRREWAKRKFTFHYHMLRYLILPGNRNKDLMSPIPSEELKDSQ